MNLRTWTFITACALVGTVSGAVIDIQLTHPPTRGTLICRLHHSANTFGDLRASGRTERFAVNLKNQYQLTGVPAGTYALVVFLDQDIRKSPIVSKDHVLKGFLAVTYVF